MIFYRRKMTPFIERCFSSAKPKSRFSVSIIKKFGLWFTLELPSVSPRLKRPLFQVYHLFSTEIFPWVPPNSGKVNSSGRSNKNWDDQRVTRKVAVQCVRSKLAWQKVFRQLISLQKKQSVTFVHKLVDSSHLADFVFPRGFPSEYLN